MKYKKMQIVFVMLFLLAIRSAAQQGTLSGRVIDSIQKTPVMLATVSVFKAADTSLVTYRMTDDDGKFKITGLPGNVALRVIISYEGFSPYRHVFSFTKTEDIVNLENIFLTISTQRLEDVIVWAERPPVIVKKDTIEFNANSFKTLPNALVEDLLKKLPGIQIDGAGGITVNGKAVSKILVDGKSFFGNDPKVATKNLPANLIDKVQVVDDEEALLQYGGGNLHQIGKVINLTFKKNVKKGWFGKVYAGGGSNRRYEYGAILNHFRDTLQISMIGYANNLNRPGFSFADVMQLGGFNRSNLNMSSRSTSIWSNGSGSNLNINGINFGGGQNMGGIATSKGGGININHAPSTKKSIYLQYFLGNVAVERTNNELTKQYVVDSVITGENNLIDKNTALSQYISLGGKLRPNKFSTFTVNINAQFNCGNVFGISEIDRTHNYFGAVSNGRTSQTETNTFSLYNHIMSYSRISKVNTQNRVTISNKVYIGNHVSDVRSITGLTFIYPIVKDSSNHFLRAQKIPNRQVSTNVNITRSIIKNILWRTSFKHEYFKQSNGIQSNTYDSVSSDYSIVDLIRSNTVWRSTNRVDFGSAIEVNYKQILFSSGIQWSYMQYSTRNKFVTQADNFSKGFIAPSLSIQYKGLYVSYYQDLIVPDMSQLLPVTNDVNPYYVIKGNLSLRAPKKRELTLYVYHNNFKRGVTITGNGAIGSTIEEIGSAIRLNQAGSQSISPINVSKSAYWNVNYNLIKEFRFQPGSRISIQTGGYYGFVQMPILLNDRNATQRVFNFQQWLGLTTNFNDFIELNHRFSIDNSHVTYHHPLFSDLKTFLKNYSADLIIRYPRRIVWENSFNYVQSGNYVLNPFSFSRWNFGVNYVVGKNEQTVLRVSVFDLFNAGKGLSTSAVNNSVSIMRTNILGRYVSLTVNYTIRKIGSAKTKVGQTSEKLFLF